MVNLHEAVGPGQPNRPADVRLVEQWLNWWVTALNHLPFQRLNEGILWFQGDVMGDPFASGIVEPKSVTESNLQQRPSIAPATFPARPPVGPLPSVVDAGVSLRLPARTGYSELTDQDYAAAASTLKCDVLAIKAVALQEGKGHGFDAFNRPVILYEPLHFLRSHGAGLSRKERPHFYGQFRSDFPALTKLKPKPHQYGTLAANWQYLQWAYLLDPHEALCDVSWGEFQILGSNATLAGYASAEQFVAAMCRSLQDQLQAFVHFLISVQADGALAKKDWAAFAAAYNGGGYQDKRYDLLIAAKYQELAAQNQH